MLLVKIILNSLLHFLQDGSGPMGSGGRPLRSGRPLGVLMVEWGKGSRDSYAVIGPLPDYKLLTKH